MSENVDRQREAQRIIHDEEVAKILAMSDKEREVFIDKTLSDGRSSYLQELLVVDSENPDVYSVFREGGHSVGMAEVRYKSDLKKIGIKYKKEEMGVPIEYADFVNPELEARLWRGTFHSIGGFDSLIIKLALQIEDPAIQDLPEPKRTEIKKKHLEELKNICRFFKEKNPDWIMVDAEGNALEGIADITADSN